MEPETRKDVQRGLFIVMILLSVVLFSTQMINDDQTATNEGITGAVVAEGNVSDSSSWTIVSLAVIIFALSILIMTKLNN